MTAARRFKWLQAASPLQANGMPILFVIAGGVILLAALIALFGDASPTQTPLFTLIGVNFILLAVLGAGVAWRVRGLLFKSRAGEPAPRLHRRFVVLFSLAAVIPAILIALFFGVFLTRGLETWFGERVEATVESSADTARFSLDQIIEQVRLDVLATASDFTNPDNQDFFSANPEAVPEVLEENAQLRVFRAAYILSGEGDVLVSAESNVAPQYQAPAPDDYEEARDDILIRTDEAERRVSALYALDIPAPEGGVAPDLFLYVVPDVNRSLFDALISAQAAVEDFRQARSQRSRIQLFFLLIYAQATVLILLGAAWVGLASAGAVIRPVGRLVTAAESISRGDLSARVDPGKRGDELSLLSEAFNRMAEQLETQREELIRSHEESDVRRRLLEAVIGGVSAGVITLDAERRVSLANRSAETLLEAPVNGLTGRELSEISSELNDLAAESLKEDEVEGQIELETEDGHEISLIVRARADVTEAGGVLMTFDDITRLIAAQRNEAWRDVARRIAHEIKNPLTPIQLSAERLKRRFRPEEAEAAEVFDRCIETVVRQVSDIGRMINEFSTFARMPTPHVESVNLLDMVQEAVFARSVAAPDVEIVLHGEDCRAEILCDERLASQALTNVLKNATEAVMARLEQPDPPRKGVIEVSLREGRRYGVIEVEDNGLGWPDGAKERLTEPYMTTRDKGTGLGLAIVKRVMEDHGGDLALMERSDRRRGARVRLRFPLDTTEPQAGEDASAVEAEA